MIYEVIWKVILYSLLIITFQFLEEVIPLASQKVPFFETCKQVFNEVKWPSFWAIHIFIMVFLIIFVISNEIIKEIGLKKFKMLFFSKR